MLSFFFNLKLNTDLCTLPKKTGVCRAMFSRWFYNPEVGHCELFTYGGCNGNSNNFKYKQQCEQACSSRNPRWNVKDQPLVTEDTTCSPIRLPFIGTTNLCLLAGM